jgi:sugar transferase (PEP-CTERM system associated)
MIRIFSQYVSVKSILLVIVESFLVAAGLLSAVKLRFWKDPQEFDSYTAWPGFAMQAGVVILVCLVAFYYNDLYDLAVARRRSEEMLRVEQSLGGACLLLGLVYFLFPDLLIGRGVFFISVFLISALILLNRSVLNWAWRGATVKNAVILGTGDLAMDLAQELGRRHDLNFRLVGIVHEKPQGRDGQESAAGVPILGDAREMEKISKRYGISRIIVAIEDRRNTLPTRDLVRLRVEGVEVEDIHSAMASLTGRVCLRAVRPSWFVFSDGFHRSKLTVVLKRAFDLCFGVTGAVLSAPIMLSIALAIRLDSPGPVIYRQARVGWRGQLFELLKFRSMREDAEAANGAQWALKDDPRVTRLGRVLRKYRLDELPQFFNVIRGDMSFVGPRPERPVFVEQLRELIPYYDERHSVRPGVTGWAQVKYRYGSCVEDAYRKLEYDLFYLKNMSLLFDCVIVLKTMHIVLSGEGAR